MKRTLISFRYANDVIETIDTLYEQFLKHHKKKASIELFYSEYWKPEMRWPEARSVVAYYKPEQELEVTWMENYIESQR